MGVLSVQTSAVQGIQRGLDGLRKNASEIASAEELSDKGKDTNLENSLVDPHYHTEDDDSMAGEQARA